MGSIFGGSKQKSSNQFAGSINDAFSGLYGQATQGANALSALLGGDSSGFDAYKDATGFDALTEQGSRGITGNQAAAGLLRSGGTNKAIANYYQTQQNSAARDYTDRLLQQAGLGLQAGQLVGGVGTVSKGKSKNGIGGLLGTLAAGAAVSDIRLKRDIYRVGTTKEDIPVYRFRYLSDDTVHTGVMAQDVAVMKPEALGPVIDGFMTVNYDKLEGII